MWLLDDTRISGYNTVGDWKVCKTIISDFSDRKSWEDAYKKFFGERVDTRYLTPIRFIIENGTYIGEGFSVMTIQCALVEFLESTYQGLKYRFLRRGESLNPFEYNRSQDLFESFLPNREPFKRHFNDRSLATDFYKNIRCGLLHEASTKGNWIIRAKHPTKIVEKTQNETIVYRTNFQEALEEYLELYKQELLCSADIKQAFIRKIDSLCEV